MADNTLKTRLLSAYNTLDFWSTCTIIPLGGEVCYGVDDDNKILEIKIGDGVHKYSELPAQSFDSADHLYKLSTPISTTTAVDKFTATTYLQVNDGQGGSSYSNSSSAVLTIPAATATAAGLLSKDDKVKLNGIATGANKVEVAEGTTNGTIKVTTNGTASTVKVHGLGDAAFKSTTGSITTGSALPTEGAVKTYVDGLVANATHFCGGFTASGDGTIDGGSTTLKSVAEKVGDMYVVTTAGTFCGIAFEVGDSIIFKKDVAAGTAVAATDFIAVEATVTVTNSGPTLAWNTVSTVGTVEGTALTVKLPANPNTDTKVTAVGNHYTPSSSGTYTASASGAPAAWGIDVVKGITLYKDAAGHITTVSVESGKIPANPNTNYYTTALNGATTATGYHISVAGNNAAVKGSVTIPSATSATFGVVKPDGNAAHYLNGTGAWTAPPNTNYYTTASTRTTAATSFQVKFDRNDGTNKYSFTIPEATETMAGVSSTVNTDRLRNGSKTLILDGNFTS